MYGLFLREVDRIGVLIKKGVSIDKAILISGSPRSGTTFLMEIVGSLPYYKSVFEPFHIKLFPEFKKFNFFPKPYLPVYASHPGLYNYLCRCFKGQLVSKIPHFKLNMQNLTKRIIYSGIIAKFVRANRLVPWILKNFDIRAAFIIIRHPCATILSQLQNRIYGYFTNYKLPSVKLIIKETLSVDDIWQNPNIISKIISISSRLEALALSWAVDVYIPMIYRKNINYKIIFYEDLLQNYSRIIESIFNTLKDEIPYQVYKKIHEPSLLVSRTFSKNINTQLFKWRKYLKPSHINRILKVIDWFELNIYDNQGYPCSKFC